MNYLNMTLLISYFHTYFEDEKKQLTDHIRIFKYPWLPITTTPFKLRLNSKIRCLVHRLDLYCCEAKNENKFKKE